MMGGGGACARTLSYRLNSEAVVIVGKYLLGWTRPWGFGFGGLSKDQTGGSGGDSRAGSNKL